MPVDSRVSKIIDTGETHHLPPWVLFMWSKIRAGEPLGLCPLKPELQLAPRSLEGAHFCRRQRRGSFTQPALRDEFWGAQKAGGGLHSPHPKATCPHHATTRPRGGERIGIMQ